MTGRDTVLLLPPLFFFFLPTPFLFFLPQQPPTGSGSFPLLGATAGGRRWLLGDVAEELRRRRLEAAAAACFHTRQGRARMRMNPIPGLDSSTVGRKWGFILAHPFMASRFFMAVPSLKHFKRLNSSCNKKIAYQ
jgi:hypothetical protein